MSNICARCGGAKLVWEKTDEIVGGPWTEVIAFTSDHTTLAPVTLGHTPSILKLCNCPPEQPKHDGKLDDLSELDDVHAVVELLPPEMSIIIPGWDKPFLHVRGGYGDIENCDIYLDLKQALSLLVWLEQNREKLELWAKEQEV